MARRRAALSSGVRFWHPLVGRLRSFLLLLLTRPACLAVRRLQQDDTLPQHHAIKKKLTLRERLRTDWAPQWVMLPSHVIVTS